MPVRHPSLAVNPSASGGFRETGSTIWWLHPAGLLLAFILPLYLFVVYVVPTYWPELIILRARDYLSEQMRLVGACVILALGLGALIGSRIDIDPAGSAPRREVREGFIIGLGLVVFTAYIIWFAPIAIHGGMLQREQLNRIAGVTSFTQLGVPFALSYLYATVRNGQRFGKATHTLFGVIMCLTLFRVYAWSERLALIEVAVPIVVVSLTFSRPQSRFLQAQRALLSNLGPFLGLIFLWLFFAVTEVVRSWTSYSQKTDMTLSEFVTSRIATYYWTALNNGAGMLATSEWPTFNLLHVLEWLYKLPLAGSLLRSAIGRQEGNPVGTFLVRFGDVEFNNMSGIFPIILDLGVPLGLLYFAALGLATGCLYRALLKGEPLGALLYPPLFVGCLEVMRISYVNNSRALLVIVGGLVAVSQFRRNKRGSSSIYPAPNAAGSQLTSFSRTPP